MNQEMTPELWSAVQTLRDARLNTDEGMPEALFLLVSALVPIPNVDLLVTNEKKQVLLSWRDDPFFEKSWHIPGGCMRYGETMEERVRQTALKEFGCEVDFDPNPMAVRDVIRGLNEGQAYPRERGHNIAVLYHCVLKGEVRTCAGEGGLYNGCLKWFDKFPENLMKIQTHVYRDVLSPWF